MILEDVYTKIYFEVSRINFHPESNQTLVTVNSENIHGSELTTKAVTFGENTLGIQFNEHEPKMHASNVVTEGDEVHIECQIGFTHCGKDIYWFFNNKLIKEFYPNIGIKKTNTKFSRRKSIIFKNFTKSDEGLYECLLAKSENRRKTMKLTVNSDFQPQKNQLSSQYIRVLLKSSPKIYSNFNDNDLVSRPLGNNLELTCRASGNPKPSLKWFKNGEKLKETQENSTRVFTDDFKLIFENVGKDDAGNYSCLAENEIGSDQKAVQIIIEGK